jgi:hypothetical protein
LGRRPRQSRAVNKGLTLCFTLPPNDFIVHRYVLYVFLVIYLAA